MPGRSVTYEYDYDQLIAVQKPFGTDVKYEYGPPGSPENGVGRIVRVLDDAGFETRGYGKLGEVIRSTRTVKPLKPNDSPQTFETRFKFDSFGRMLTLWYPDGEQLDYTYDVAGLVNHAQGHRPATKHWDEATEVYLASMTYDEFGAAAHGQPRERGGDELDVRARHAAAEAPAPRPRSDGRCRR